MQTLKILNTKETKNIKKSLYDQFGVDFNTKKYAFLESSQAKIYIVNRFSFSIDLKTIRIDRYGIYFATREDFNIRLSIEGSQIIGKKATKNIVKLDNHLMHQWISGKNIEFTEFQNHVKENISTMIEQYIIIQHNKDFYGCGKVSSKTVLNFVPKERRIDFSSISTI